MNFLNVQLQVTHWATVMASLCHVLTNKFINLCFSAQHCHLLVQRLQKRWTDEKGESAAGCLWCVVKRTIFYPSTAKCWWGIVVSLLDVKASVTWGGYRAIFQLLLGWILNCDLIIYHYIDRRVLFGVLHIYKLCFFYCDQLIWIFAKQMFFTYF